MPSENDGSELLLRDEHYKRLIECKEKIKLMNQIILEGQYAEEFISGSPFWPIFQRTFESLRASYNADAHKAAKDLRADITNYLGREEAIMDMFNIIGEFSVKADHAESEKKLIEEEIKQLQEILSTPDGNTQDVGGAMG